MRKILLYVAGACIVSNLVLMVIVFGGRSSQQPRTPRPGTNAATAEAIPTNTLSESSE